MSEQNFITITELCPIYEVNMSFFEELIEHELIEITTINQTHCIHPDHLSNFEKILRLHDELEINLAGIDTIFNLLKKIDVLQSELADATNKLRLYEDDFSSSS